MKYKLFFILLIVFLCFSEITLHYFYIETAQKNVKRESFISIIPERFRSFIAALLWEKADKLMHEGPVISKQKFYAGSYAGNTDIIPYIKMVIALCPNEVAPYRLLASNYAYHLGMSNEALKIINEAINNCNHSVYLHELFASATFVCLFGSTTQDKVLRKKELELAEDYINKAIENYKDVKYLSDPVFKLENYYFIRCRILWELEKYDEALDSWLKSGKPLEESNDKLAQNLLKYQETGVAEKLITPVVTENHFMNIQPHIHQQHHHHH